MILLAAFVTILLNSVDSYNVYNVHPEAKNSSTELVSVIAFMRHGDRSPRKSFPNDKYFTRSYWPMGFEQLTNQGKNRHYKLGQWLRSRYGTLISTEYSPDDIYVFSTDTDRSLMSAAANLAGLYPPTTDQIWNTNLQWQPIPIHSCPRDKDDIFTLKRNCSRYDELYEEVVSAAYYKRLNQQYSDLFTYVSQHSGWQVQDISSIKELRSIFYCEENYNKSYIPNWAESLNMSTLNFLSGVAFQRYSSTRELKRLRTGPFFNYIFTHFDGILNSTSKPQKFLFMSGHDTYIASALDAMGVYDFYPPNFGAALLWELKRNQVDALFVNIFYRKEEDSLIQLTIPGCNFNCPYEQFKSLMKAMTVEISDWVGECSG